MTEGDARREGEWRAALADLVAFYEAQRAEYQHDRARLTHDVTRLEHALAQRTAERDAAHARIAELSDRNAELEKPFRHLVKAIGRRFRPQGT